MMSNFIKIGDTCVKRDRVLFVREFGAAIAVVFDTGARFLIHDCFRDKDAAHAAFEEFAEKNAGYVSQASVEGLNIFIASRDDIRAEEQARREARAKEQSAE